MQQKHVDVRLYSVGCHTDVIVLLGWCCLVARTAVRFFAAQLILIETEIAALCVISATVTLQYVNVHLCGIHHYIDAHLHILHMCRYAYLRRDCQRRTKRSALNVPCTLRATVGSLSKISHHTDYIKFPKIKYQPEETSLQPGS